MLLQRRVARLQVRTFHLCSTRLEQCLPHQVTWYSGADGNEGIPGIPPCPAIPTAGDIPASLMIVVWCVKLAGSGVAPAVRRAPQGGGHYFYDVVPPSGAIFFSPAGITKIPMSDASPCTSSCGATRGDSDEKDATVGGTVAPSATVTWGQTDRIFAMTETTDAQLARVRSRFMYSVCANTHSHGLTVGCGYMTGDSPARSGCGNAARTQSDVSAATQNTTGPLKSHYS